MQLEDKYEFKLVELNGIIYVMVDGRLIPVFLDDAEEYLRKRYIKINKEVEEDDIDG